jgi:glycopeptide antibiotics resistance protein
MNNKFNIPIAIIFFIYLVVLIKLLFFKYPAMMVFDMTNGNYVPFKTILNYLSGEPTWNIAIRNIGGNILLFTPLGFFLPFFCSSITWKFVLLATFIISVAIEITQGIFRVGIFDIDDILLNVFGAILGYGIYFCLKLIFRKS